MSSLSEIADNLRSEGNDAYDGYDSDMQELLGDLGDVFDDDARDDLRDIMVNHDLPDGADNLSEAVKSVTSNKSVKEKFTNKWDEGDLVEVQYKLKQKYNNEWEGEQEAIAEIKQMFVDNNISELNEMCAERDYRGVFQELDEPDNFDRPESYADCTSMVARVQGIKQTLTQKYQS